MSNINITLEVLGITDTHVHINGYRHENHGKGTGRKKFLVIQAVLTYQLARCPECGFEALYPNGHIKTRIHINSANDRPVVLELKKQRWRCHNCGHTCTATTPVVKPHHTISCMTAQYALKLAKKSLSLTTIAAITGISPKSVQRIINTNIKPHPATHLPENLCFDEFRSTHDMMSFICIDADKHGLVTVLGGRLNKEIKQFFSSQYSEQERAAVKHISMDMNASYQNFVHELFPNAEIVIDRFHIVQLLGRAMDQLRVQYLKQLDPHSREHKVMKTDWRLFHKAHPNASKMRYLRGLNEYSTEQNAIDLGTDKFPAFKAAYEAYIDVHEALMNHQVSRLKALITNYQRAESTMDTAMTTLRKNLTGVLNAARSSYSNGPIEGKNRKIKQLKRNCYGFANQENMFIRIFQIAA